MLNKDALNWKELSQLKRGWDSYNAEPPSQAAITKAKQIAKQLTLQPTKITPSAEGGVAITFIKGRRYADIECFNEGSVVAGISSGNGRPACWELNPKDPNAIGWTIRQIRIFLTDD